VLGNKPEKRENKSNVTTGPTVWRRDEPGDGFVDGGGVLGTFVERREPPDLDNSNLTPPPQALACGLNSPVPMAIFLPIGGYEKDVLVDYDLAIMDFVPSNRLRKPIFDADVAGVLERLGHWNDGLENDGEAARPLRRKNVSPCGTCRL
jgi:hypothetical protein